MTQDTIGIIGAGIAGLSCAATLKQAGLNPIIFDKGRGLGGRLATRRTSSGLQFDHGAQYATAHSEEFGKVIAAATNAGQVASWDTGDSPRYVGVPGMNGLARFLARGLDIHQETQISAVRETADGCDVTAGEQTWHFKTLAVTVPAPQAITLLGEQHALSSRLSEVELLPCLTLMAAFSTEATIPFTARRDPDDPLSWIALDSSKPRRPTQHCWVAHANPQWSAKHLEADRETIAELMLPLLCERLGVDAATATHAVAHRWRYALVSKPLGSPFLRNADGTLYLGGDWCLDARIEAAWTSGHAIASDILQDI